MNEAVHDLRDETMNLPPLSSIRIVDLTHAISADAPVWPGDPATEIMSWATIETQGYSLRRICTGEHSGTHIGMPAHLAPGGLTVDRLPPGQLIRPCVVIDIRSAVGQDPDTTLTVENLEAWESRHDRVPAGSVVLLCTGWSSRWPDPGAYFNADSAGALHFPGFGVDAVRFLVEDRDIAGLGIDTSGIDPGIDGTLAANRLLSRGRRFHLENLTNLDQLPVTGVWLFIGALPVADGGGAPARVLALIPPDPFEPDSVMLSP